MTILFLALWLQMSAVGEIKFTPENQYVQFPTDTGYIRCPANPGTLPLACKTSDGEEVTVGIVQSAEPVDVPAMQVGRVSEADRRWCIDGAPIESAVSCPIHAIWTCTDKSRVLLTSEDGKKHCIKF